jgi:hypothetical protein
MSYGGVMDPAFRFRKFGRSFCSALRSMRLNDELSMSRWAASRTSYRTVALDRSFLNDFAKVG